VQETRRGGKGAECEEQGWRTDWDWGRRTEGRRSMKIMEENITVLSLCPIPGGRQAARIGKDKKNDEG
jgi:hypothetical protein